MHVVFMGPPGSGKGTQAVLLASHLSVPHLSTGDMLRAAKRMDSDVGNEASGYMDDGHLVPDQLVVGVLIDRIKADDCRGGALLDGFPRTVAQAEALDKHLEAVGRRLDIVIELSVPEPELVRRLTGRATKDKRTDDTPDTIQRRLEIYQQITTPLRGYYHDRFAEIQGLGTVEEVFARILDALPERRDAAQA